MTMPRFKAVHVVVPILIGIIAIVWLFYNEFNFSMLREVEFSWYVIGCIGLAWLFMIGRDFGLSWRFKLLTDSQLDWYASIRVNMLCEFTSAITPSAVGGSSFGMFYLYGEGVKFGRAATLMLTTLFLDELFFVVACPIIMLLIPYDELFGMGDPAFREGLQWVFWIVYSVVTGWTLVLFIGIFVKPTAIRRALIWLFHFKLLARWMPQITELGDTIVATSRELRSKSHIWWLRAFFATIISWTSRFLVINALFLGFVGHTDQLVVFGRQFIVWVALMASPTPGGSGVSEWLFTNYYGDLILGGAAVTFVIALFWRLISYYIYLVVGTFLVPAWIRRRWRNRRHKNVEKINKTNII